MIVCFFIRKPTWPGTHIGKWVFLILYFLEISKPPLELIVAALWWPLDCQHDRDVLSNFVSSYRSISWTSTRTMFGGLLEAIATNDFPLEAPNTWLSYSRSHRFWTNPCRPTIKLYSETEFHVILSSTISVYPTKFCCVAQSNFLTIVSFGSSKRGCRSSLGLTLLFGKCIWHYCSSGTSYQMPSYFIRLLYSPFNLRVHCLRDLVLHWTGTRVVFAEFTLKRWSYKEPFPPHPL